MNNSELVSQLGQLVATNRFSPARKACLGEFIGQQYSVRGTLSRISNTTGYLRDQELRKGKTVTLRLDGCDTELTIRCNRTRSADIAEHDVSAQVTINVTITGYDDVRQQLNGDELGNLKSTLNTDVVDATGTMGVPNGSQLTEGLVIGQLADSSGVDDHTDQLLAELEQMQAASQQLLATAAGDIHKVISRNVPLVVADPDEHEAADPPSATIKERTDSFDKREPTTNADALPAEPTAKSSDDAGNSRPLNTTTHPQAVVIEENDPVVGSPTRLRSTEPERVPTTTEKPNDRQSDAIRSDVDDVEQMERQANAKRAARLRLEILSAEQKPIEQNAFGEVIALKTGVPVKKVREIQTQLWQAIVSPTMFGRQREIFNFFPFGDFRLMRNRDVINVDFKSAPVTQLAEHDAVEVYPHSNFDGSDADSNHPPIATHAIRIAATVAPLVGLSPPVTYDVIFETLQLLLKIFGVGKRRIRFADIGEFFPVVLRGTLQYHFRPYRPLIRFATESFRAIISMVEHEGEGQLAFEADNGVPDRAHRRPGVVGNRAYSRPVTNTEGKKKISIVWVVLILAVIVYQAIQFLLG